MKDAPTGHGVYGVMAEFQSAEATVTAIMAARRAGYLHMEAYSPYPVPALADALGVRRTFVPTIVLCGGLLGCVTGYFMQYYFNAVSYPVNVGGRPLNSWPSFIPVTFELTILFAVFAALIGTFALCRLPRLDHPLWNVDRFSRVSRDRFFLCIESTDPKFDPVETRRFLLSLQPEEVTDVPAQSPA
jgi:hypothetical protein